MRRDRRCFSCQTPLTGGLDTWGDVGMEFCWACYSPLQNDRQREIFIYDDYGEIKYHWFIDELGDEVTETAR